MATVVTNSGQETGSNGIGMLAIMLAILAIVALVIFYGIPALGSQTQPKNQELIVPEKIDVNVKSE